MRSRILRSLSTAGVAAIMGLGYAAASAAAAPVATRHDVSLNVSLYCLPGESTCYASASGGTGGYSFSWTNATEYYSEPGYSEADVNCSDYISGLYVRVKVTDSLGATATAGKGVDCNPF